MKAKYLHNVKLDLRNHTYQEIMHALLNPRLETPIVIVLDDGEEFYCMTLSHLNLFVRAWRSGYQFHQTERDLNKLFRG